MAIQTFNLPVDFLNNLERPPIYIAKKDKTILGAVSIYDDLSLTFNLNAYQTASFKIYRDINGKRQKHYDDFQEDRLIMIQGIAWYKIHVETNIENTGISKSITANSLECTLCNKRLIDFECNTGEILYNDYVRTIFYDPSNPKGSLLHRVLNVAPSWSVGHVDATLANMQRSFDVDDNDVYSFLTGDVSEAFNCLFIFDTFNQTVNAYDLDNYGEDTSIYVSMDNLAQSMTESIDENSIITCYRVNGGDGIYINEVNPNSTNKIYNFEYYLPEMEESLQNKVKLYNEKYQSLKPQYEEIMKRLGDQISVIQELETRLPDSLDSKDWTKYGLQFLDTKVKSFKTMDELYCAQGMNKPDNLSYNLYIQNLEDLNSATAEYNKRQSEIDSATEVYNSIIAERNAVQAQLDMDEWFTLDEWKSLDCYVVEETYDNDNFITTDNTTDTERFDIERQLYETAWKDLSKKCRPQYQYTSTLSNVLTIPQFKGFLKYFQLGNFIRMATDYDTVIKLRLISFTVDYNDTSKIDVTFSDAIRVHDIYDDAASIQAQANSAAMSFQFNKDQYDKSVNESNFVAEMRKYGLDVATTQIHNSKNQSQVWDESGMTFRMWNDERQDFDPEQIKIINNMMVFTDSGFDDTKMAIGKISLSNGTTAYGINAEVFVGTAIFSQYFTAQNPSGTFKIDDSGLSATNGINTIKIQPNNSGELFSIYKGNSKQLYFTSDGDAVFSGSLKSASGQFAGLVSGGSININNVFQVDKYGKMTATSCNITGNISSSNITSSSATFGGITLDSNGLSSNQFSIDAYGNASFSGTLSAASITSSGALNDYLTSSDLGASGTTSIDGGRITTGTISADRIDTDTLVAKSGAFNKSFAVGVGGSVSGTNLTTTGAYMRATEDSILMGLGLSDVSLRISNREKHFYGNCDYAKEAGEASSAGYADSATDSENAVTLKSKNGTYSAYIRNDNKFSPERDNSMQLGSTTYRWKDVWAGNGTIQTSDRNAKKNIEPISDKLLELFELLMPVSFQFIDGTSGRTHIGFISQDVEWAMGQVGLTDLEFAGFCKDVKTEYYTDNDGQEQIRNVLDENGNPIWIYSLRYSEFIALNTAMIQRNSKKIDELTSLLREKGVI